MNRTQMHRLARYTLKGSAVRLSLCVLAAALTVISTPVAAGAAVDPQPSVDAQVQWVGVFTGKHVNGVPVYRLPPVTVIADRKQGVAKMEREERLARAHQVRSKAAARPPV